MSIEKLTEYEREVLLSPHDIPLTSVKERVVRIIDSQGLELEERRKVDLENAKLIDGLRQELNEVKNIAQERMELWLEADARVKELEREAEILKESNENLQAEVRGLLRKVIVTAHEHAVLDACAKAEFVEYDGYRLISDGDNAISNAELALREAKK